MNQHGCKFYICQLYAIAFIYLNITGVEGQPDYRVLPVDSEGMQAGNMVKQYLQRSIDEAWIDWQQAYEQRTASTEISAHNKYLRTAFIRSLGGFPRKTPLNAKITGRIQREGYTVEKLLFESQPGFFVTGNLFLPDPERHEQPWPAVLVPCGHYRISKAHVEYQSMGALLALNGMAALVYDPVGQGERLQLLDKDGNGIYSGTPAHTMAGICATLLGSNLAAVEIWDGMRAIDYLQSRPEINPDLIGCTGNSGGATQTSYLMALDDRIKAAAPSCFLHRLGVQTRYAMGDAEQNIYGQLRFGLDHPDYLMMRAPVAVLVLAATHDYFKIEAVWESFRYAKRLYTRLGYSERMAIFENDAGHNYNKAQREAAAGWMSRWLPGRDEKIHEPEIRLLSEVELRCTPRGQTLLMDEARSIYDIFLDTGKRYETRRKELWRRLSKPAIRDSIRRIAGIRSFDKTPQPGFQNSGKIARQGYHIEKIILTPEPGIQLPVLLFTPSQKPQAGIILYTHAQGKTAALEKIEELVRKGNRVFAVDLRGTGETQQMDQKSVGKAFGYDWEDVYKAYLLGTSYVGMRAEDILACSRYIKENLLRNGGELQLVANGHVGVPALHAAALEPQLFSSVKLINTLVSWADIIEKRRSYNQLQNTVHGALRVYDLPDLIPLADINIQIEEPMDAQGFAPENNKPGTVLYDKPTLPGLAGIWYSRLDLVRPRDAEPVADTDISWPDDFSSRGNDWSANWFGWLKAASTGNIRFFAEADHPVVLLLDGNVLLEGAQTEGEMEMISGKFYHFELRYNHQHGKGGHIRLSWDYMGGKKEIIGDGYLWHSTAQHKKMGMAW